MHLVPYVSSAYFTFASNDRLYFALGLYFSRDRHGTLVYKNVREHKLYPLLDAGFSVSTFSAKGKTLWLIWLVLLSLIPLSTIARSAPIAPVQGIRVTPIHMIDTNAGRVMSAHASRHGNRVYIDGLVDRPSSPGIGPLVHVWGVDKNNHIVFFKTTSVTITGNPSFIRTESYLVTVASSAFDRARIIYVTFHSEEDAQSRNAK